MTSVEIEDLKQFIDARISQSEARLSTQFNGRLDTLEKKVDRRFASLEKKMDDGFAGVAEALDQMNEETDKTNRSFDRRLTLLENRPS